MNPKHPGAKGWTGQDQLRAAVCADGMGESVWRATGRSGTRAGGVWKEQPRHDEASHGADAFLTFACSGYTPPSAHPTRTRRFGWVVRSNPDLGFSRATRGRGHGWHSMTEPLSEIRGLRSVSLSSMYASTGHPTQGIIHVSDPIQGTYVRLLRHVD